MKRTTEKPVIGMPVQRRTKNSIFSQSPEYSWAVEYAGGLPLLIPLLTDVIPLAELCDGFILTGSVADVAPGLYGASQPDEGYSDPLRDKVDYAILRHAEESGKPVLGICRGCQIMNVYRGGTLAGQISDLVHTQIDHDREPDDLEVHYVNLVDESVVARSVRRLHVSVNSLHRQACAQIAPTLKITGVSEDGVVEAIEDQRNPSLFSAVQWHPELLSAAGDPMSRALFDGFIETVKQSVQTVQLFAEIS